MILQIVAGGLWLWIFGLNLLASLQVLNHLRPSRRPRKLTAEGISVIKPLKGLDISLQENLETIFQQDDEHYEILFSIADPEDPARAVVTNLMRKYPNVSAQIFIGDVEVGANPKVRNMIKPYEAASFDIIVISDSNVRVQRDYLANLRSYLGEEVGVVSSIISGRDPRSLGAHLEAAHLHGFVARGIMIAQNLGHSLVLGKSMMFRRSVANRFGGMRALGRYLAEDHATGIAMRGLGLKAVTTHEHIEQHLGDLSLKSFWKRHIRWGRLRKATNPLGFALEILCHPLILAVLGSALIAPLFGLPLFNVGVAIIAILFSVDAALQWRISNSLRIYFPVIWVIKELAALMLWLQIASGSSVDWRGRKLYLQRGGLIEAQ